MGKNVYSSESKWAVVKDKMNGQLTTKEIMKKHVIKNKSQIETWMRWHRANEIHRFDQPIGKQYSYGHEPEVEKVNEYICYYNENRILEKLGYLTPKEFGAQAA